MELLYEVFMDRTYDESGRAYWIGQLATGMDEYGVFLGFVNSVEFAGICESFGVNVGEPDAYQGYMPGSWNNRTYTSSEMGFSWTFDDSWTIATPEDRVLKLNGSVVSKESLIPELTVDNDSLERITLSTQDIEIFDQYGWSSVKEAAYESSDTQRIILNNRIGKEEYVYPEYNTVRCKLVDGFVSDVSTVVYGNTKFYTYYIEREYEDSKYNRYQYYAMAEVHGRSVTLSCKFKIGNKADCEALLDEIVKIK